MRWIREALALYSRPSNYRPPDEVRRLPRHRRWVWLLGILAALTTLLVPWSYAKGTKWGNWRASISVSLGRVVVWWTPKPKFPPPGPTQVELDGALPDSDLPRLKYAGQVVSPGSAWQVDLWYASVPLWMMATALWLGCATVFMLSWPWGYCRRCGYNLRTVSPLRACPECGGVRTRS